MIRRGTVSCLGVFRVQERQLCYRLVGGVNLDEIFNGFIALPDGFIARLSLGESGKHLIRDPTNLKPAVPAFAVSATVNVISELLHFPGQRVSIDLSQVRAPFINAASLQCFPSTLFPIEGQVSGNSMRSSTSLSSQAVAIFPMRRLCGNRPSRIMRQIVVRPRGIDFLSSLNRMYLISVVSYRRLYK